MLNYEIKIVNGTGNCPVAGKLNSETWGDINGVPCSLFSPAVKCWVLLGALLNRPFDSSHSEVRIYGKLDPTIQLARVIFYPSCWFQRISTTMATSAQALRKWDQAPTQPLMTPLVVYLHTGYGIYISWTMAVLWAVVKVNQHLLLTESEMIQFHFSNLSYKCLNRSGC